jgi:hypothetical protein
MSNDSSITTLDDNDTPDEPRESSKPEKIRVPDNGKSLCGERVELIVHAGEGEVGRQAVFLGINGHGLNIPRSIAVDVPIEVIEILDNATMTVYEQIDNKTYEREVKRFSYNVKNLPKEAPKAKGRAK